MNALLNRTRSTLALGAVVMSVAAGTLASAPAASACPIDVGQTSCVGSQTQSTLQFGSSITKQKHVKQHAASARHQS